MTPRLTLPPPPVDLFAGLAVMSAVVTYWFAREAKLLAGGERPYTWWIRNYDSNRPARISLALVLIGFAVGAGVTHFVLDEVQPG